MLLDSILWQTERKYPKLSNFQPHISLDRTRYEGSLKEWSEKGRMQSSLPLAMLYVHVHVCVHMGMHAYVCRYV